MVPSAAPGAAASVIKQAPLAAASLQRPATSIGGGCGGGEGGGAEACTCSLGAAVSGGVLVHALVAASATNRMAAVAPRPLGPLHMDPLHMDLPSMEMVMQAPLTAPVGLWQNPLGNILYSTLKLVQWWTIDRDKHPVASISRAWNFHPAIFGP